ncbi:MAG TPA: serine protease [Ilumatobacteraceae bacterium]
MKLHLTLIGFVISALATASCRDGASGAASTTPSVRPEDAAMQVVAFGCSSREVHGAGSMVAEGRIATVAHVVAGAERIEVRGPHGNGAATVVYFDPVLDVAVLKVDPRLATPVPIATAKSGDRGTAVVYRDDVPVQLEAEVERLVDIRTEDIYGEGKHLRPGYELKLDVEPGDSGSAVIVDGKAVAIVWATSQQTEARSWAMRTSLVADHLAAAVPVDHGHCA